MASQLGDFKLIFIGQFLQLSVPTFQPLLVIDRKGSLLIIIGDVHQFSGHCLIPLDPFIYAHILSDYAKETKYTEEEAIAFISKVNKHVLEIEVYVVL